MSSLQLKRISDERVRRLIACGAASALAAYATDCSDNESKAVTPIAPFAGQTSHAPILTCGQSGFPWDSSVVECENIDRDTLKRLSPSDNKQRPVSWMRRTLAYLHLKSLPIPRQLLAKGDPIFRMDPKLLKKRQDDEIKMQNLIRGALQERDPDTLKALNTQCLELAYGDDVTLKSRQDFVHRHGCTAWTEEVLDTIIALGNERGIVEIGAGNGQWARALTEHYKNALQTGIIRHPKKKFDFVLAYDDQSELPLDQNMFNKRTQIYHNYFYEKVQYCDPSNFSNTLRQFQCRGRVLLLVFPPPGKMAVDAVEQYASASNMNDTVIYVGEGRGGANANEDFFGYFEKNGWVLMKVMKVKPLGSKGYECLYVLKRPGGGS